MAILYKYYNTGNCCLTNPPRMSMKKVPCLWFGYRPTCPNKTNTNYCT